MTTVKKTAIIYSFNTSKTSQAAKKIAGELGDEHIEHVNAESITESEFMQYDRLILGVPTWFDGELPNYWDEFVPALEELKLTNKIVAIFGNGDQKGYPENFVDGIGIMADLLEDKGAKLIGYTSAEDYQFESSRALRNKNQFAGLALDYENQGRKINQKIKDWAKQLKNEF